jgi:hypothetical protein
VASGEMCCVVACGGGCRAWLRYESIAPLGLHPGPHEKEGLKVEPL